MRSKVRGGKGFRDRGCVLQYKRARHPKGRAVFFFFLLYLGMNKQPKEVLQRDWYDTTLWVPYSGVAIGGHPYGHHIRFSAMSVSAETIKGNR